MQTIRRFRPALMPLMAAASALVALVEICPAQELLPDIVPWVREDDPYLVNWDILDNRLRVQTMYANVGDGLFEIRTDLSGTGGPTTPVTQRVFVGVDNGPIYHDYFVNNAVNFHAEHGHIHFENFSEFQLLQANIDPTGVVTVGGLVANEVKTSFRIRDSAPIPDPQFASAISYPSSNLGLYQNISAGYGDVYSHGTDGQSISLAGVPYGPWYWLRQIVDPTNVIREKDDTNNSFEILIDLNHPGQAVLQLDGSFVQPGDVAPPLPGDLTGDRLIDLLDWAAFKANANSSLLGVDDQTALVRGDLNLDRQHTLGDTLLFRQYFDAARGAGAFAAAFSVPEPAALCLGVATLLSLYAGRASRRTNARAKCLCLALLGLLVASAMQNQATARTTLFLEDFEGLALGPNVDETLANPQAWTDSPPSGWNVNDSGVPFLASTTRGVTEWKGWSFADKAWWTSAAGDQGRSQFSLGQGTVAVADPDEWDDKGAPINSSPFGGYYNALMTTPAISLAAATPNAAKLTFSSSWLPECCDDGPSHTNNQTATVRVSYNGGASFSQILRWESNPAGSSYKAGATNETVILDLHNPANAATVVVEFGMLNAGNDWWWALDNVEVFTPTVLEVDTDTGEMSIVGAARMSGYEITSPAGSLAPSGWTSHNLDAQNIGPPVPLSADFNNDNTVGAADYTVWRDSLGSGDAADANGDGHTDQLDYVAWKSQFGQSLGAGESWETLLATPKQLQEFFLRGDSTFAAQSVGLGYNTLSDARDLSFTYSTADGLEFTGVVRYVSGGTAATSAVPEPAAWTISFAAILSAFFLRRVRGRSIVQHVTLIAAITSRRGP